MSRHNPLVSIAIPCYNGAEFLARSVSSVLDQTLPDFEIVVTDDGSTDESLEILENIDDDRIRVFAGKRIGAEANWNRAVSLSTGEFVKLLPQDDLLRPECLERQVAVLRSHTSLGLTACKRDIIGPDDNVLLHGRGLSRLRGFVTPQQALTAIVRSGTNLVGEGGAVLMRREAFHTAGGFSGSRPYVIDLDLWLRIIRRSGLFADPETLASFRVSSDAWTANLSRVQTEQIRSLFTQIKDDPSNRVGFVSYLIGWVRAGLMTPLRRAVYRRVARRQPSS